MWGKDDKEVDADREELLREDVKMFRGVLLG